MATVKNKDVKVMILKVDRDIDGADMTRICEIIESYRSKGYAYSILDLGTINHVDFLSLRRLSQMACKQRKAGGDLVLSGISGYLKNIFQIVGVYNDFQYFTSCCNGLQKIRKDRQAHDLNVAVINGKGFKGIQ